MTTVNEQAADFLREVQDLIADPNNWCQFTAHRKVAINAESPYTFIDQWCLTGAMNLVVNVRHLRAVNGMWPTFFTLASDTLQKIVARRYEGRSSLPGFNDSNIHEDVMLVLKDAIHELET